MSKERMIGTVAGVNRDKGFFFICGPDGRDYIAWAADMPNHQSLNTLTTRVTRIEFTPKTPEPPKGPAATNLVVLEEAEPQHDDPTARRLGQGRRRS